VSREVKVTLKNTRAGERRLTPATTSIPRLIDVLKQFEKAVRAYAPKSISDDNDTVVIALVGVQEGSVGLSFVAQPEFIPYLAELSEDLDSRAWNSMPLKAYTAVKELHSALAKLEADFEISQEQDVGISGVVLTPLEVIPDRLAAHMRGETTLSGELVQVGGAKPKIDFRLDMTGKILHIDVPESTAQKLGSRLYQPITITGDATWNSETWEIETFEFKNVTELTPTNAEDGLESLQDILGDTWLGVDAEDFISNLRGGRE
jgi:hypothetical protein